MRNLAVVVAALVGLGTAAACSSSNDQITNPVNTSCSNLSGTFTATSFTATGTQNTSNVNNFLNNGGAFNLSFNNGSFNSSFTSATGATPMTQTGAVTTSGTTITLGNNALWTNGLTGAQSFTCGISGNTLTLSDTAGAFMFPGDTVAEPARFNIVLTHS